MLLVCSIVLTLCGKAMAPFSRQNIANEVEGPDLAAAVGRELGVPNGPLHDLVDVARRRRFSVDLGPQLYLISLKMTQTRESLPRGRSACQPKRPSY
jgi:hypothetical protein